MLNSVHLMHMYDAITMPYMALLRMCLGNGPLPFNTHSFGQLQWVVHSPMPSFVHIIPSIVLHCLISSCRECQHRRELTKILRIMSSIDPMPCTKASPVPQFNQMHPKTMYSSCRRHLFFLQLSLSHSPFLLGLSPRISGAVNVSKSTVLGIYDSLIVSVCLPLSLSSIQKGSSTAYVNVWGRCLYQLLLYFVQDEKDGSSYTINIHIIYISDYNCSTFTL